MTPPDAQPRAEEWVAAWCGGRRGAGILRSLYAQSPEVQEAIRRLIGGGA